MATSHPTIPQNDSSKQESSSSSNNPTIFMNQSSRSFLPIDVNIHTTDINITDMKKKIMNNHQIHEGTKNTKEELSPEELRLKKERRRLRKEQRLMKKMLQREQHSGNTEFTLSKTALLSSKSHTKNTDTNILRNNNVIPSIPNTTENTNLPTTTKAIITPKSKSHSTPSTITNKTTTPPSTDKVIWPTSSADSLPPLDPNLLSQIQSSDEKLTFPINEQCTSLAVPPSGRHILAGFTDGTVRIFDTTSRFWNNSSTGGSVVQSGQNTQSLSNDDGQTVKDLSYELFDCESSSDEEDVISKNNNDNTTKRASNLKPSLSANGKIEKERNKTNKVVPSKSYQSFGAVACQIHARGVITSLLMDVTCAEDGLYAFGGVLRGSTELVAIDLSCVEQYHDEMDGNGMMDEKVIYNKPNILDLIRVHRFSDAKLKGFGACTRLKHDSHKIEYLLFTGKGIKNMHIWSFVPPQGDIKEPIWQCLYDTPTNGNSITYLTFRHDPNGLLQGISKSDDQKLRVWDLSYEQHKNSSIVRRSVIKPLQQKALSERRDHRPKRPPYIDISSTESSLGVCGPYVFSGGSGMYHKICVTGLDVEDIQSQFNYSELPLPGGDIEDNSATMSIGGRRSRPQRGDLKSVVNVAGHAMDAKNVILEMSDGILVHYSQCDSGEPTVQLLPSKLYNNQSDSRSMSLSRVGSQGLFVLSTSSYDTTIGRGIIMMAPIPIHSNSPDAKSFGGKKGYWGFHGVAFSRDLPEPFFKSSIKKDQSSQDNKRQTPVSSNVDSITPASFLPDEPIKVTDSTPLLGTSKQKNKKSSHSSTEDENNQSSRHLIYSPPPKADISVESPQFLEQNNSKYPTGVAVSPETKSNYPDSFIDNQNKSSQQNEVSSILKYLSSRKHEDKKNRKDASSLNVKKLKKIASNELKSKSRDEDTNDLEMAATEPRIKKVKATLKRLNSTNSCTDDVTSQKTGEVIKSNHGLQVKDSNESIVTKVDKTVQKSQDSIKVVQALKAKESNEILATKVKTGSRTHDSIKAGEKNEVENLLPAEKKPKSTKLKLKVKMVEHENNNDHKRVSRKRELEKATLENSSASSQPDIVNKVVDVTEASLQSAQNKAQKDLEEFLASCHKRKRPKLYNPKPSASSRADLFDLYTPVYKKTGTIFVHPDRFQSYTPEEEMNLMKEHDKARRKLALHHRASHERLRNSLFASADQIMNIVQCEEKTKSFTKAQLIEYVKRWLNDSLSHHKDTLNNMLFQQENEAKSLSALQTMERGGVRAPLLQVSFPFPEVFDQVPKAVFHYIIGENA